MDAYHKMDQSHEQANNSFEARNDQWESCFDSLRLKLMAAVVQAGFETQGVGAILERTAADIIDLVEKEKS